MQEMGFNVRHLYGLTESYGPSTVCDWQSEWDDLEFDAQVAKVARQGVRTRPDGDPDAPGGMRGPAQVLTFDHDNTEDSYAPTAASDPDAVHSMGKDPNAVVDLEAPPPKVLNAVLREEQAVEDLT